MHCKHTTKTFPFMQKIKSLVDLRESQIMSNVLINLDFLQNKLKQKSHDYYPWITIFQQCCINALNTWEIFTFFKYFSTSQGTCDLLLKPPKAVPFHTRPVTNWKGRVDISCPDAATPTITDVPQPWQFSTKNIFNSVSLEQLSPWDSSSIHLVAAFQSRSHHGDISNALKTIINSTIREIGYDLLNWFLVVFWINELSDSKVFCCNV